MNIKKDKTTKCNCKTDNEVDMSKTQEKFEYAGCDDKDNPTFKCKVCGVRVWG